MKKQIKQKILLVFSRNWHPSNIALITIEETK